MLTCLHATSKDYFTLLYCILPILPISPISPIDSVIPLDLLLTPPFFLKRFFFFFFFLLDVLVNVTYSVAVNHVRQILNFLNF